MGQKSRQKPADAIRRDWLRKVKEMLERKRQKRKRRKREKK